MESMVSAAAAGFLENYQRDASVRWSVEDLAAQRAHVNAQVAGCDWLDWSTPAVALQLLQAAHAPTTLGARDKFDSLVLAGPVVELLDPETLFEKASHPVKPGGRLVGILPCLRDNSPESRIFGELAAAVLWPYYTAEELLEWLRESDWEVDAASTGFFAVRRFNEAVLKDQLGFKGFNRIFTRLMAEGYDPMETGWGELRMVGRLKP